MKIAKAGNIHNFCHPNSLFTLQVRAAVCWAVCVPCSVHCALPINLGPPLDCTDQPPAPPPPCSLSPQEYLNDYGSEEAKRVGEELIEKERVIGLSDSAQVRLGRAAGPELRAGAQPTPLLSSQPHQPKPVASAAAQDLTKRKLQKVNEGEHDVVRRGWPGAGGGLAVEVPCMS